MNINKDNRTLVNVLGAPFIIFSIMYNQYSFLFLIFSIILFSFYEYVTLIIAKSKITFLNVILGFLWVSSIGFFLPLHESQYIPYEFILLIFFSVWITDSAAFLMGKKFGKRKIFPLVSANKTWVGSISGLLFSMTFLLVIYFSFDKSFFWPHDFKLKNVIFIGLITGIFSQVGDFLESYFKRVLSVKDSSDLLLGHGGFLDRFDSMFAVSFGTYLYLVLSGYHG